MEGNGKRDSFLSHDHMASALPNVVKTVVFEKLAKFATRKDAQLGMR
jgi:hypothetical protein